MGHRTISFQALNGNMNLSVSDTTFADQSDVMAQPSFFEISSDILCISGCEDTYRTAEHLTALGLSPCALECTVVQML